MPIRGPLQNFERIARPSELEQFLALVETQFGCPVALPVLAPPLEVVPYRDGACLIPARRFRELGFDRNRHGLTVDHIFHI